jgi:hypothetical protein
MLQWSSPPTACALTTPRISAAPDASIRTPGDACRDFEEVSNVPTEMVTKRESRAFAVQPTAAVPAGERRFRAALRHLRSERTLRRWVVAWLGASVLGIVNGGIRDFAYEERVGESTAGQISTGTLIALLALFFWVLQRSWPLATRRDALSVGAIWVVLTVLFEFGFGSAVEGLAWGEMLEPYDVTKGNIWILVLLWIAVGPMAVRAIAAKRPT